jgi:hypothetical protein
LAIFRRHRDCTARWKTSLPDEVICMKKALSFVLIQLLALALAVAKAQTPTAAPAATNPVIIYLTRG